MLLFVDDVWGCGGRIGLARARMVWRLAENYSNSSDAIVLMSIEKSEVYVLETGCGEL